MNIPDKAIFAILESDQGWPEEYGPEQRAEIVRRITLDLQAAAPFIAAQALRDAAEEFGDDTWESVWAAAEVDDDVSAVQATVAWLRAIADDLEAGK